MRRFYKLKLTAVTALFAVLVVVDSNAQTGVSINATGTAPDAQAILDVSSTTKGALLPRMTTAQAVTLGASLNAADDGMIIYDITVKGYKYWDGALLAWQTLITTPGVHNDLDGAYDQGGAGAGRVITADAGAVDIQGSGGLLVSGNVGIGATTAARQLDVYEDVNSAVTIRIDNPNTGNSSVERLSFSDENGDVAAIAVYDDGHASYPARMRIFNNRPSGSIHLSNGNGNISLIADGNVGISTTSPSVEFDVDGSIRMRTGATNGYVPVGDANGVMVWTDPATLGLDITTASNGLTEVSDDIQLGGPLTQNTTVSQGAFALDFTSNAVDGFSVDGTTLSVDASNNRVGIGNNAPTYDLDVTGNTATSGDFYGDIHVDDTRNDNFPPTTYDKEVAFDFKNRTAVGVGGSGTYSGMMTIAPWGDNSGDASHQINFNEGGLFWRQGQPDGAAWGTWYKIITTADGLPTGSGTTNYLARWTPDGSTLGIGTTYDDGTNVGLGTTTPITKLDVRGQATLGTAFVPTASNDDNIINVIAGANATGNQNGISFYENTSGFSMSLGYDGTGSGATNAIRFYSDAEAPLVTVENGGNVGIGTTTPDADLNVGNTTGATLYLTREDNVTTTNEVLGSLMFDSTDDTGPSTVDGSAAIRGLASQDHGNSNKGAHLTFLTKDNVGSGASATERMRIQADGNVGIGTTSITSKLTVAGGIGRTAHNNGHLEGSYNNVGANSAQTNPIYTIGSGYNPDATVLNNMYGIGYSHTNASFITDPGPNTWGMYVAADGDARVWLGASGSGHSYFNTGGNVGINTTTPAAELHVDGGTSTEVRVESDDNGASTISAHGVGQGTGRLFVGQSTTYGGGIEYNGDNNPTTTGAGADYITLWRRAAGVDHWTARNYYNNNNWQFRANVDVDGYLTVGNPTTSSTKKASKTFVDGGTTNISSGTGNYNFTWNMGQLTLPPGASSMRVKSITYNMTGLRRDTDESIGIKAKIGSSTTGWTLTSSYTLGGGGDEYYDWNYAAENLNWDFTSNQTVQFQLVEENETCWLCNNDQFSLYNIEVTVYYEYYSTAQAGSVFAAGRVYANSTIEMGDMAEYFEVGDADAEVGHVVSLVKESENDYKLSDQAYDPLIVGVISANPSVVLNNPDVGPPVALAGRVEVQLVPGMPLIKSGDFITSSPQRGLAMKANKAGTVIGYAVENQIEGENTVEILLQQGRFYHPSMDQTPTLDLGRKKESSGSN